MFKKSVNEKWYEKQKKKELHMFIINNVKNIQCTKKEAAQVIKSSLLAV